MNENDPLSADLDVNNVPRDTSTGPVFVKVDDVRPDGYDGTCLRPLGLCELGGSCDACWYRPDHPRFQRTESSSG